MSFDPRVQGALARYQMQVNFVAPTALNADTVFTDNDTALTFYQPLQNNKLLDVKHTIDPVAGLLYTLFVRRQDLSRKRIGATGDFLTAFNGMVRPNMPRGLKAGWFQFVEQQGLGALTAQNYLVTFENPLAV
jgi:hypothetical protein